MDNRVCTHKYTQITTSAKWFWLWCASLSHLSLSLSLSLTSEGYYTKFCSIILSVCKLLSSGRLHNVWCSMSCTLLREVVGKSVVQSNDFVNNFSAFGSLKKLRNLLQGFCFSDNF